MAHCAETDSSKQFGIEETVPVASIKHAKKKKAPTLTAYLLGPGDSGKSEFVKCLIKGNPHRSMGVRNRCFVHGLRLEYATQVILNATECRGELEQQLEQLMARKVKPDVVFLFYDSNSMVSFKEMRNKWLVALYPKNIMTIVIGNKSDLPTKGPTKLPKVSDKAWSSGHMEISSITSDNVGELISRMVEIVLDIGVKDSNMSSITRSLSLCSISSQGQPTASAYDMKAKPKGICLLVSIRKFDKDCHDYRYGTEKDEKSVKELFIQFGFKVILKTDINSHELRKLVQDMAKMDHSQYKCFVCVVMSHGDSKSILASDGRKIAIDEITHEFKAEGATSLRGKPKVFFYQSCRGVNEQKSENYETDSCFGDDDVIVSVPNEADFIIARATVDGSVSYRNPSEGSYYINMLVSVLKASTHLSLVSCLTIVNEKIAEMDFCGKDSKNVKQMPCFQTTLRKELYLGL